MHAISNRLAALATLRAAAAALVGLTVSGLYVDAPNWVQQAQGTDLATLFLAVPVLTVGLWTARRGWPAGSRSWPGCSTSSTTTRFLRSRWR